MTAQPLPAVDGLPPAARQHGIRPAHRAEDRRRGRQARIEAVAGGDADVYGVERGELARVGLDHGGGEPRRRACAADDADACSARLAVDLRDAGDERARVREIDVVAARADAGAREAIRLGLKGAGSVDEHGGRKLADLLRRRSRRVYDGVSDPRTCRARKLCRVRGRRVLPAPGDDHLQAGLARKPLRYPRSERAVAADDEYAAHMVLPEFSLGCGRRRRRARPHLPRDGRCRKGGPTAPATRSTPRTPRG
jgi:hypothetical protein